MLAIRLQRRGRKNHSQYRVIVQDSRFSPKSEKIVAYLGSYDPHSKEAVLDKELAETYLSNGAQPSNRVARIMKEEKVKLPSWVKIVDSAKSELKNPEKLRRNRPNEPSPEPKVEDTEVAEDSVKDDEKTESENNTEKTTESDEKSTEATKEDSPEEESTKEEEPTDKPAESDAESEKNDVKDENSEVKADEEKDPISTDKSEEVSEK